MKNTLRHFVTVAVLAATLALYYFGIINDIGALLLAAAACELWFMTRATRAVDALPEKVEPTA